MIAGIIATQRVLVDVFMGVLVAPVFVRELVRVCVLEAALEHL